MSKQKVLVKLSELQEYQQKHLKLLFEQLPKNSQEFMKSYMLNNSPTKEETAVYRENLTRAQEILTSRLSEIEKKEQKTSEEQALIDNPAAKDLSYFYKTILRSDDEVTPVFENLSINFNLDGADLSGSKFTSTYFKSPVNSTLNLSSCDMDNTKFETTQYHNVGSYLKPKYELSLDFPNMYNTTVQDNCLVISTGYTFSSTNALTEVMERQNVPINQNLAEDLTPDLSKKIPETEIEIDIKTPGDLATEAVQAYEKDGTKEDLSSDSRTKTPKMEIETDIKTPADLATEAVQTQVITPTEVDEKKLKIDSNTQDLSEYAERHRNFLKKHGGLTKDELTKMQEIEGSTKISDNDAIYLKECYNKAYQTVKDMEAKFSEEIRNSPDFSSRGSYAEYLALEKKTGQVQPVFENFVGADSIDTNLTAADLTGTKFKNCQIDGIINTTTILAGATLENTSIAKDVKLDYETSAPKSTDEIVKTKNNIIDILTLEQYAKNHQEYTALSAEQQTLLTKDSPLYKARAGIAEYLDLKEGEVVTLVGDGSKPIIKNCDLSGADLSNVNFNGAYFENVTCEGANFEGAELSGAYFKNCEFKKTSFKQSTLSNATLDNTSLDNNTTLNNAQLNGIYLKDSNVAANLALSASLQDKVQIKATNSTINLSSTTNLELLNTVIYPSQALVEEYAANSSRAGKEAKSFTRYLGITGEYEVKIKDFDLTNKDFSHSNFEGVTFENVRFKDANFSNANLSSCQMKNCNLKRAKFNEANLTEASLTECKLVKAEFQNAEMSAAKINGYQEDIKYKLVDNLEVFKDAKNFTDKNLNGEFPEEFKAKHQALTYYQKYVDKPLIYAQVATGVALNVAAQSAIPITIATTAIAVVATGGGVAATALTAVAGGSTIGCAYTLYNSSETRNTVSKGLEVANNVYDAQDQHQYKESKEAAAANVAVNKKEAKTKFNALKKYIPSLDKVMVAIAVGVSAAAVLATAGLTLPICAAVGVAAMAGSYVGYSAARQKLIDAKNWIISKITKISPKKEKLNVEIAKTMEVAKASAAEKTIKAPSATKQTLQAKSSKVSSPDQTPSIPSSQGKKTGRSM